MLPSLDDGKRVWDEWHVRSLAALFSMGVQLRRVALKDPSRVVLVVAKEYAGFTTTRADGVTDRHHTLHRRTARQEFRSSGVPRTSDKLGEASPTSLRQGYGGPPKRFARRRLR